MKSIKLEVAPKTGRTGSNVIRISSEMYAHLSRLSVMTRLPIGDIANRLMTEALNAVELVEIPLYDMKIKEE